jgi:hypothetical protein
VLLSPTIPASPLIAGLLADSARLRVADLSERELLEFTSSAATGLAVVDRR